MFDSSEASIAILSARGPTKESISIAFRDKITAEKLKIKMGKLYRSLTEQMPLIHF
jgi:hypothetical protein